MIETSTPANSLLDDMIQHNTAKDGLSEEELYFYRSVKNDLNKLAKSPSEETVEHLLNYSKSL